MIINNSKMPLWRLLPFLGLFLAGCTLTDKPKMQASSPEWQLHKQAIEQISEYQTRGAFAYLNGQEKVYARFFWQQSSPERYALLLTNPLGNRELEMRVEPEKVWIIDGKGETYAGSDPESIILKYTRIPVPITYLRQWLLGLPGEDTDYSLSSKGLLNKVTFKSGRTTWKVDYQSYNDDVPPLPNRLELTQDERRIKLKMDSWTVK